jgi:excisionase family DNA binding protein
MTVERLAMSVTEAAAALGVSKDAIYDAVRCHELPAIRIRRRILTPLAALEQLLARRRPDEQHAVSRRPAIALVSASWGSRRRSDLRRERRCT